MIYLVEIEENNRMENKISSCVFLKAKGSLNAQDLEMKMCIKWNLFSPHCFSTEKITIHFDDCSMKIFRN